MIKDALKTKDSVYRTPWGATYERIGIIHARIGNSSVCMTQNIDRALLLNNVEYTCFLCFRSLVDLADMKHWVLKPSTPNGWRTTSKTHAFVPSKSTPRTLCAKESQHKRWAGTFLPMSSNPVDCKVCLRRMEESNG